MAGPLILTGNKISFTYLRLLQTNGTGGFFDGSGDSVNLKEIFSQENAPIGSGTDSISDGALWYKIDTGVLYVYTKDEDSSQWVQPG
jgi:hypothetical protein